MIRNPYVVVITGPTGAGKSDAARTVAKKIGGEIISLDLRLAYPGLRVLGAGPPRKNSKSSDPMEHIIYAGDGIHADPFSMAGKIQGLTRKILENGNIPIWSTGAHLLLSASLDSLVTQPATSPRVKARIDAVERCRGPQRLHQMLLRRDPLAAARIHPSDAPRLVRALGLAALGQRARAFPKNHVPGPVWIGTRFHIFSLSTDSVELKKNLRRRLEFMIRQGALDEVRNLDRVYPNPHPVRTALGFPHLLKVIQGHMSLSRALELCLRNTVRYSRRQKNYLKRIDDVTAISTFGTQTEDAGGQILDIIEKTVS